jgi:hypothetical protein
LRPTTTASPASTICGVLTPIQGTPDAPRDIAGQLYLSGLAVRDYVKAIVEKVGVSSRGEHARRTRQ